MILVIPDSHNYHGDNTRRFDDLGKHIASTLPAEIVIMGDWFDMHSINRFDKAGSLIKEGERIMQDLVAGISSLKKIFAPMERLNRKLRDEHRKQYNPKIIFLLGNHEKRLETFIDENPVLQGVPQFDIPQILANLSVPFAEIIGYGKHTILHNIIFTHILFNGGRPISGRVNTCGDALKLVDQSVVFAHTHRLEFKQFTRLPDKKLITAFNVGCFLDEPLPAYMIDSNPNWWSGVSHLYPYGQGSFDILTINIEQLRRKGYERK